MLIIGVCRVGAIVKKRVLFVGVCRKGAIFKKIVCYLLVFAERVLFLKKRVLFVGVCRKGVMFIKVCAICWCLPKGGYFQTKMCAICVCRKVFAEKGLFPKCHFTLKIALSANTNK